jgi:hypothetical protein
MLAISVLLWDLGGVFPAASELKVGALWAGLGGFWYRQFSTRFFREELTNRNFF